MIIRLIAAAAALALVAPMPAPAKTFRAAVTADASTLDPHASNAAPNNLLLVQIYEALATRGKQLEVEPSLATRWERPEPTRWRFHLRPGVRFQGGEAFTADDVVFSLKRALAPTSNYSIYMDSVGDVVKVDDLTVDVVTKVPDAILVDKLTRVFVMSRAWSAANKAELPQNFAQKEEHFAARNSNGTGPFRLKSRELDVRTVLEANPTWWGKPEGNVTEYVHNILGNDATRVAALLSGEVDFVHTLPTRDVETLRANAKVRILEGMENRTMFFGMDQIRDELPGSNVKGKNPFKDVRVRRAIYQSIDVEAIKARTMRGLAVPTGSMWTQYVNGYSDENNVRWPYDRETAKKLMIDAGYPQGFSVQLDCPTGAYNVICEAIAPMLKQIDIDVRVNLMPAAQMFPKIVNRETSFYGLSWGVPTFDAMYTLRGIIMSKDKVGAGSWNGGYSNPKVDEMIERAQAESDGDKRRDFMRQALKLHNDDVGHLPIQHMMIPWALAQNVAVPHRADNVYELKWVKVD